MPKYLIYPLSTLIFAAIMVVAVPRKEILRLSIYGIIFGGIAEVFMLILGGVAGLYRWTNYGPFAFLKLPLFSPITWALYYITYFYFLPKQKPLNYVYVTTAIFFSTIYINAITNLDIFYLSPTLGPFNIPYSRIVIPIVAFAFWYSLATWGFYRLNSFIEGQQQEEKYNKPIRLKLSPQPARKIVKEDKTIILRRPQK